MSTVEKAAAKPVKKKVGRREKKAESKKALAIPDPQWIDLNDITFDEQYQMRENIPPSNDYCEMLKACADDVWPFTPLVVASVSGKLFMIEGFTRSKAAKDAGKGKVFGSIVECTKAEAFKLALGANSDHGFRRTNADKRKAVRIAIGQWPGFTASKIAEICKVSHTYVYNVLEALKGTEVSAAEGEAEIKPSEKSPGGDAKSELKADSSGSKAEYEDFDGDDAVDDSNVDSAVVEKTPVDLRAQNVEKARKELGRLIRSLEDISVLKKVQKHVEAISAAIA